MTVWPCISPISVGNPLLLNPAMQPDLTVGRTYSSPICFQDSIDKELFDPLPDIKVNVQSSFMVSLGVDERAEIHGKGPPETFPRGLSRDQGTVERRSTKKGVLAPNGPFTPAKDQMKTTGVFGHLGGRLVVPNTGRLYPLHVNAAESLPKRGSDWITMRGRGREKYKVMRETRELLLNCFCGCYILL